MNTPNDDPVIRIQRPGTTQTVDVVLSEFTSTYQQRGWLIALEPGNLVLSQPDVLPEACENPQFLPSRTTGEIVRWLISMCAYPDWVARALLDDLRRRVVLAVHEHHASWTAKHRRLWGADVTDIWAAGHEDAARVLVDSPPLAALDEEGQLEVLTGALADVGKPATLPEEA